MKEGAINRHYQLTKELAIIRAKNAARIMLRKGHPINEGKLQQTAKKYGEFSEDYCEAYRAKYMHNTPADLVTTQTKEIAIKKGKLAGHQQAFRGRTLNEEKLLKEAKKFGEFSDDYCNAYRAAHSRHEVSSADEQVIRKAQHLARKRFSERNQYKAHPTLEIISALGQKIHRTDHALFTVSYAQHYNKLLLDKGFEMVESLIMPPYKRPETETVSQVDLTASTNEMVDMLYGLKNSRPVIFNHVTPAQQATDSGNDNDNSRENILRLSK